MMEPVQDRLSFMARRARFGFKGKPYKKLSYVLTVQYDNLGKDKFSGARGGTNTGTFGVLDAYITWQLTKNELDLHFNGLSSSSNEPGMYHRRYARQLV